ncbi:ferrous iron transport protein B [Candidatus Ruminimicrobiellum ovillum]|uniref:ferrous iron transport protein B n=1 Tax=Candidatus Ruminimicrobiellum ovillum TaxID=1947927 RepID=UPI00355A65B4
MENLKKVKICLAGNPNCGKSSLFNNITGLRQHVGNYPGVTVEKKEAFVTKNGYELQIIDLPGIYGLSASSEDEIVARNVLIEEKPELVIDVVDSSNLERNLYLYAQLSELKIPVIIAMNMTDILENKGQKIDYKKLEEKYNVVAVPIVASKNKGTEELLNTVTDVLSKKKTVKSVSIDYGKEINKEKDTVCQIISEDVNLVLKYPVNFLAVELIKKEPYALDKIKSAKNSSAIIEQVEKSNKIIFDLHNENLEAVFADKIYDWIKIVVSDVLSKSKSVKKDFTEAIDKIVLNKIWSVPIFLLVMYIIFKFAFTVSEPIVGWFEAGIEWLSDFATGVIPEGIFQSLIVDGIIGGVGGVLGFFPQIICMFFAIAFFEDTGYMARAVFIMDRVMRKFGLHGKSFASLLIATNGCAVPAMMASRTIDNPKDRIITLLVTPFMICGAKLPIFALFIAAFFSKSSTQAANTMFIFYTLSVVIALFSAWVFKKTLFKGEPGYFVMELPPYRVPTIKGLLLKMWERGWMYLKKAGTIILLMSIIIWAGLTFPQVDEEKLGEVSEEEVAAAQMDQSYIGKLGHFIEPVIKPIGFDGKMGIALIAGLAAKEVVVSTLGTIYSMGETDVEDDEAVNSLADKIASDPDWSPLKSVAFLMFCLIYVPCIVAIAVFYREAGSRLKWLIILFAWTTVLGYLLSFIVYQGGRLLGF